MTYELRESPPASARMLGSPLPRHQAMIDGCDRQLAGPFVGVHASTGVVEDLFPLRPSEMSLDRVAQARNAFVSGLGEGSREGVSFPVDTDNWRRWCNIHRFLMRHGLLLDSLSKDERDLALGLVASVLGERGFSEARGVMKLNETIQEISGRLDEQGFPEFGEWMYWISLMGEASANEPWGWQLDGHHLNINCLLLGDQIVVTPFFLGSEPLEAESGRFKGVRILDSEEHVALELVQSLDAHQRARAIISPTMPSGLFTGAFCDNVVLDYEGISYGELEPRQREELVRLIRVYVGRLSHDIAEAKMREIEAHLDETYFSWMGETTNEDVFYYRVHSPVILLEFDHEPGIVFKGLEPMKSHIHTMMRTPNGNDYGLDYIRQHRQLHRHHNP
ncbi:MAG TPA: DUF3500 domain-containing protein [Acidimicrobiales bacterium]|nr:DUF3500 domain-containing protein [Acidimicrobiales bacterium]